MPKDTGVTGLSRFDDAIPYTTTLLNMEEQSVSFVPMPHPADTPEARDTPAWRIRLGLVTDTVQQFGYEVNGEVILGRDMNRPDLIDLSKLTENTEGLSRQHLLLRPTPTNLYALDLGSTNGSLRNGSSIGVKNPTPIYSGDLLDLGGLQLFLYIVDRPAMQTTTLQEKVDQAEALSQIAKAITSQLDPDEVLNQVVETAHVLTAAGETAIWLVDEQTGELFLEAEKGIEEEKIRRLRIPIREDNPAGKVVKTGQALRAFRRQGEAQIKVKTGYLVESLLYVPITLGGTTLGVLGAGHQEKAQPFSRRDERLLTAIADFAAIAIQNARIYQKTDRALERRVRELSALNEVSHAVSSSLDLARVYQVLVEQLNRHWPVEAVRLFLYSERQGALVPVQFTRDLPATAPFSQGLMWQAATRKLPIVANDVTQHPAYVPAADNLDGHPPHAIACVPLTIKEKVVGVLALYNRRDGVFGDEDVMLLRAFAAPVATAIENARLFAESRKQQAAIQATAHTITEPLLILDEHGRVLVSNVAARKLLDTSMSQLFDGISRSLGKTAEVTIGEQTFLATSQHLPEVGTIVVMQDITYVKRLEKDRAEFMRALSHDLKSPLTSIKGFAQLLEKVVQLNEKSERFINQILHASERMLNMINQMLQVTRDEAIVPDQKPCSLEKIAADVVHDVEGAALHKRIHVELDQRGTPYAIQGDATRLYHMMLNLVDNAVKYSPEETEVRLVLDFREEGAVICVRDQGPGIPEAELPRVFDKYYRGEHGKRQQGTGVGLSVVLAIAEAHDGIATVRNHPDGGAEFTITLPPSLRLPLDA